MSVVGTRRLGRSGMIRDRSGTTLLIERVMRTTSAHGLRASERAFRYSPRLPIPMGRQVRRRDLVAALSRTARARSQHQPPCRPAMNQYERRHSGISSARKLRSHERTPLPLLCTPLDQVAGFLAPGISERGHRRLRPFPGTVEVSVGDQLDIAIAEASQLGDPQAGVNGRPEGRGRADRPRYPGHGRPAGAWLMGVGCRAQPPPTGQCLPAWKPSHPDGAGGQGPTRR